MAADNPFHHQRYTSERPSAPYEVMTATPPPPVESVEFTARLRAAGQLLRAAGVKAIYLVHGTFTGNDAWGIVRQIGRFAPQSTPWLKRMAKNAVDFATRDCGNYSQQCAELLEQSMSENETSRIPVRLFTWTGENHHLGRADCAIRLIDELQCRFAGSTARVLLWGHSHAGNAFALMTCLLGSGGAPRHEFFRAAYSHFVRRYRPRDEVWWRVHKLLRAEGNPLSQLQIDCVTFGTPIRYGWDTTICNEPLHYVYHRPAESLPEYRAKFPPTVDEVMRAAGGDYIHQLGIANTNFQPSLLDWRSWFANRRLARLLQAGICPRDLHEHLRAGMRVAEQGKSVLVDYGNPDKAIHRHAAGHAIYTQLEWLLFHAEDVSQRLYGSANQGSQQIVR